MTITSWARGTLLDELTPDDRAALLELGSKRRFAAGQPLISESDPAGDVFLITGGIARVESVTVDGRSVLLALRVAGEMVGELAPLTGLPRSAAVVAATALTASAVSWPRLNGYLEQHPSAADAVRAAVAGKFRQATRHRVELTGGTVGARLAGILRYLAEAYGQPGPDGIRIGIPLSQADLGRLIGASAASVRRALAGLRESGIVRSAYRAQIVTDPAALRQLASS